MSPWFWSFALLALIGAALLWGLLARATPESERNWTQEHAIAPTIQLDMEGGGDDATVEGIRSFRWHRDGAVDPAWAEATLDLSGITGVWFGISVFSHRWRGPAHTFLSFEFADGRFLAVSVEARREVGERYGFLRGMLRRFEVLYVMADERDLILQRALHRPDEVYLYPLTLSPEQAQRLFRVVAAAAEDVRTAPVFYHTVTDNCSTRIIDHLSAVLDAPLPRSCQILLPGYSDALLHDRGLIDTPLPLAEARQAAWINDRARKWQDAPDFSQRIRSHP